jgi:membrane protease YdiL (CAAX protease family)
MQLVSDTLAAVKESKERVWKKIAVYYILTIFFSGVFGGFVLHAGKMGAGNLLYVTGAMWSPALAVFATKAIFRERIRDLPWAWGAARYGWLAYLIPPAYALPVYLFVWLTGLGTFADRDFLDRTANDFGWQNFPPALTLLLFVLITATLGMVGKISRALGEEIGWRGFLVPELSKVVGFPGVGLISGLMWAVYHYPVLIFADYNAAILHASHNLFIQSIFTPLTKDTGLTKYIIDEFGIGLVITVTIGAVIVWRCASRGG